jgi:hypothetical protein
VVDREESGGQEQRLVIRGWLIVSGLAFLFLIYGLFMFFAVGDKGPPGWDFGAREDTPGQSVYSTNPPYEGPMIKPEPQHIRGRAEPGGRR